MMHAPFEIFGSPSWVRTSDVRINSPSLYRLSYRGIKDTKYIGDFESLAREFLENTINTVCFVPIFSSYLTPAIALAT